MKATIRNMTLATLLWGVLISPLRAEESVVRLDNFWSDGPVSVFLYEQPHAGLDPTGYVARHDLRPGEVTEVATGGRPTLWADVRIMHQDGRRWLLSSPDCGYRRAFTVHPGQTIEVSYQGNEGYANDSTGLHCRVLTAAPTR